jgi:hypothetical protein
MKIPFPPLALSLAILTGCSASSSPPQKTTGAGDSGPEDGSSSKPPGTDAGKNADAGHPVDAGHIDDASHDALSTAPPQAAAAGYDVETFSSTFAKAGVDLTNSQKSGYQWYLGQFFGGAATSPSDLTWNADGTLDLNGAGTSSNAGINTASPSSGAAGWVGVAFGGWRLLRGDVQVRPGEHDRGAVRITTEFVRAGPSAAGAFRTTATARRSARTIRASTGTARRRAAPRREHEREAGGERQCMNVDPHMGTPRFDSAWARGVHPRENVFGNFRVSSPAPAGAPWAPLPARERAVRRPRQRHRCCRSGCSDRSDRGPSGRRRPSACP